MRQSEVTSWAVIQTESCPMATLPLPDRGPSRSMTLFDWGSILAARTSDTRTQTARSDAAMSPPSIAKADTLIVATTRLDLGSTRETVPSFWFMTHAALLLSARNRASSPTGIVATTLPEPGSSRTKVPGLVVDTQTPPRPTRTAAAFSGAGKLCTTLFEVGSTTISAVVLRWTTPTRHLHLHQPMTPRRGRHLGAPHWQSAAPNSNRPDSAWVDQGCMKPPKASRNLCPLRDTRLESKGRLASVPSRRRTLQGQARRRPPTADRQRQEPSRVTASRLSSGRQWSRYHAPLGGPRRWAGGSRWNTRRGVRLRSPRQGTH